MSTFSIRAMQPEDKPALLAIAAKIWEGNDYLPFLFDEWLADQEGEFAAALLDGRLVGCGKLSFLAPGHAWLEGLRKDPEVKEGGLAVAVSERFLARLARMRDIASVRMSTYVRNLASISVNERLGFRLRLALSCKSWTRTRAQLATLPEHRPDAVVTVTDPGLVRPFIEASGWFEATGDLCPEGWRVYPWSWDLFRHRYLDRQRCLGVIDGGRLRGLAAFVHDTRYPYTYLTCVFLDAEDRSAADLLIDALFAHAAGQGRESAEIELMLPRIERVRGWIEPRGFVSWEQEDDFLVYEFPVERLGGYAGRSLI